MASAGVPRPPAKLPPLVKPRIPKLPVNKDFHFYLCCAEEDIHRTASLTRDISSMGYRCAEFFRDGAPNKPVFGQVESFVRRSVWIGLVLTSIFLTSCETKFQIEVFLQHVLNTEGKNCLILMVIDKDIRKHIPAILQPFTPVYLYKQTWLSDIDNVLQNLPSKDLFPICGIDGHVDLASLCNKLALPTQPYTYSGHENRQSVIPLHKLRDAKIGRKDSERGSESELEEVNKTPLQTGCFNVIGLTPLKRPMNQNNRHRPSVSSSSSVNSLSSAISAISSDHQTDSGIPEDTFTDDDIPYENYMEEEEEEKQALQRSYKDVLCMDSSDNED